MKFLIGLFVLMTTTVFAQQEITTRLSGLSQSRKEVESLLDKSPYREQEHKAIKSYFEELSSLKEDLKAYPKYRRSFNNKIRAVKVETFCRENLLDEKRWNDLLKNCTRNSFFLCAEDVKDFTELKKELAAQLEPDLKTAFEQQPQCK